MWRRLSDARLAFEQLRAEGRAPVLDEFLRGFGIDDSLLDVFRAQLEPSEAPITDPDPPAPIPDPDDQPAPADGCVVRSETGRISLRIV